MWWRWLQSPPGRWLLRGLCLVALPLVGGGLGAMLAITLAPRLLGGDQVSRALPLGPCRRLGLDLALAVAAGLALMLLCHTLWAPVDLVGGETTASDTAEYFWLLHTVEQTGWAHWSAGRYPLPVVLAHLLSWGEDVHTAWLQAALASMVMVGAGLFLWARALAGPGLEGLAAGAAAVLVCGMFPDLVAMSRTVTSYPVILGVWTLAAGLAAYALRFPAVLTVTMAGLGSALAFAADARGLVPGLLTLACAVVAALQLPGAARRVLGLGVVAGLVYGSWLTYNRLPLQLQSLEFLARTVAHGTWSASPGGAPDLLGEQGGWVWGRSTFLQVPETIRALREMPEAMNPAAPSGAGAARHVTPLLLPSAILWVAAMILAPGRRPGEGRPGLLPALRHRLDLPASLGWLPAIANLVWLQSALGNTYNPRYMGLAAPGLVLACALGLVALAGRGRSSMAAPASALLLLALPWTPLGRSAEWRTPFAAQGELQVCRAMAAGGDAPGQLDFPTENCVRALSTPLKRRLASPW